MEKNEMRRTSIVFSADCVYARENASGLSLLAKHQHSIVQYILQAHAMFATALDFSSFLSFYPALSFAFHALLCERKLR